MKRFLKIDTMFVHVLIIICVALLEIFLIVGDSRVFGNSGDWLIQSVSFYEYFRDLFYETGDVFPNLALHIGSGQNIYYLAYYGLFSPYLLLFYLSPNVNAGDFIMVTSVWSMIISSILLYFFLIKNKYKKNDALFGALLLLVNTGFSYFSFNYIMFIQYMPFLVLGLFGTKKFLDHNKSMLLIISVVLVITTSYYFAIPSIIVFCLYALYYYMKIHDDLKFNIIFRDGIRYILRLILSVLISCFLLLPVIYVVLCGRTSLNANIDISSLALGINVRYLMYVPNGVGLSAIAWFALIYNLLYLKKENKILVLFLFILFGIPLFILMLNGFLYIRGKVFLPFILLFIILILEMLNTIKDMGSKKIYCSLLCSTLLSIIVLRFNNSLYIYVFYLDLIITYVLLFLYRKRYFFLFFIIFFILCVNLYYIDVKDKPLLKGQYNDIYDLMNVDVSKYINKDIDKGIFRTDYDGKFNLINYSDATNLYKTTMYSSTYNNLYNNIFYNVFNNNFKNTNMLMMEGQRNLFFQKFMGVRYLLTNYDVPYGYKKIQDYKNVILYENDNVYSLGFVLSNLISYDDYNKLSFIEKLLVYQNNIVIDGDSKNVNLNFNYKLIDSDYEVKKLEGITIDKLDNNYMVDSLYNGNLILSLNKSLWNKTLVIRFNVNNDTLLTRCIVINGIKNCLSDGDSEYYNNNKSFDYVISSNDAIEELNIVFYKGIYDISDIEIYAIDNDIFDINNTSSLNIDFDKTKGDVIEGNIVLKEDGYFVFTISYDKGYSVYVDDELVDIEQVSGGFIGFKISEGEHKIRLIFEAPYAKTGRIVSLFGIVILVLLHMYERKKVS